MLEEYKNYEGEPEKKESLYPNELKKKKTNLYLRYLILVFNNFYNNIVFIVS